MSAAGRTRRSRTRLRKLCVGAHRRGERPSAASGSEEGVPRTPRRSWDLWLSLVLPFGNKARRGAQNVAARAEDRQRLIGSRQKVANALLGAVDAELGDEGGLAERGVSTRGLAQRGRIALDVEQVVGNLEGFPKRAPVIVERLIFLLRGLPEDGAGDATEAQQRAGLHLLQPGDVDRFPVAEAAFAGEIQHLPADHAADAGAARQRAR